ncbi:MAG: hypothetical protein PUC50_11935 [Bacteroidales bacterium]|nr:hypothetical protein [Bacteroidales bacterium]
MKNNKAFYVLFSFTVGYLVVLLALTLIRPVQKDKDIATIINAGLKLIENDSLSLHNVNNSESLLTAQTLFLQAYNIKSNEPYIRYCAGLLSYCVGNVEKASEILGNKYISPEYTLIQSQLCLRNNDTADIVNILSATIENQPDFIESEYFQSLTKIDSAMCYRAVAMAESHLTRDTAHISDAITMAKIGKILLSEKRITEAEAYLTKTIDALPNMNRPYFYLALISLSKCDTAKYEHYLSVAEFLDSSDPLPYALKRHVQGKEKAKKSSAIFKLPLRFEYAYGTKFRKNAIIIDEIGDMVKPRFEYFMTLF